MQRVLQGAITFLVMSAFALVLTQHKAFAEDETGPAAETDGNTTPASTEPGETIHLDHIPSDPALIIAIRPNNLFNRRQLKVFETLLQVSRQYDHPVPITQIDQVTYVTEKREEAVEDDRRGLIFDLNILRSQSPIDWPKYIADFSSSSEPVTHQDVTYYKLTGPSDICMWPADDFTYIAGPEDSIRRAIERSVAESVDPPIPSAWPAVGKSQFMIALSTEFLDNQLGQTITNTAADKAAMAAGALKGLIQDANSLVLALHMDDNSSLPMNMRFILGCSDDDVVEEKLKSLAGMNFLLRQLILDDKRTREATGQDKVSPSFSDAGVELFKNAKREQLGTSAVLTLSADVEAGNAAAFLVRLLGQASGQTRSYEIARALDMTTAPQVVSSTPTAIPPGVLNSPKMVARREASAQRMQKIVQAMNDYAAEHGALPACSYDEQDRPLLSWRVHLLPTLGYEELYNQFHLDEPWDSEHNQQLLAQMPAEYGGPSSGDAGTVNEHAAIFTVVKESQNAATADNKPSALLLVEARREVPWTQPNELQINEDGRLVEELRGWQPGGIMICPAGGTAVFILSADVAELSFAGPGAISEAE